MQAEPSPTTGSFFKPQLMQASVENGAILLEKKSTSGNVVVDEKTSSGFEFRFHTGVSTTSGLSSAGMSVTHQNFPLGLKITLIFGIVFKISCMCSNN